MQPIDILISAKALIQRPQDWAQGAFARNIVGTPVPPNSDRAVKWDSRGAINKLVAITDVNNGLATLFLTRAMGGDVVARNDYCSHGEVMEAFDLAINLAAVAKHGEQHG
jgi:hypothetical protein